MKGVQKGMHNNRKNEILLQSMFKGHLERVQTLHSYTNNSDDLNESAGSPHSSHRNINLSNRSISNRSNRSISPPPIRQERHNSARRMEEKPVNNNRQNRYEEFSDERRNSSRRNSSSDGMETERSNRELINEDRNGVEATKGGLCCSPWRSYV